MDGVTITGYPALRHPEADLKLFQVQNSGDPFAQKDLARLIAPGEIAIAVCGYYPTLKDNQIPQKRNVGHAALAVGVEKGSQRGVMTINNPQSYIQGSFAGQGNGYNCYFIEKLKFPAEITPAEKAAYEKNIITMTALANTYIPFPPGFESGDPISIHNEAKIREAGNNLILAAYGDDAARAWLAEGQNKAYCAELVSAGINTGVTTVLTKAYIEELRQYLAGENGEDRYPDLYEKVSDVINNKTFLSDNDNRQNLNYTNIGMVDEGIDLKPLNERCPNADQSGTGLAFMYFEFSDIAYGTLHDTYPRKDAAGLTGDALAEVQTYNEKVGEKQIIEFMKMVGKFKAIANLDAQTEAAFDAYVEQLKAAMAQAYPSEAERDAALEPLIQAGRQFTPTTPNGEGMFIPPDLYLLPTTGWAETEMLGVCFYSENLEAIA